MIAEAKARELCDRALHGASGAVAEVVLHQLDRQLTRFANNAIHQNVAERSAVLQIKLQRKGRLGVAITNQLDDSGIDLALREAERRLAIGPVDPELPEPAPTREFPALEAYDLATAEHPPEKRAEAIGQVCTAAKSAGFQAFGAYSVGSEAGTVANSVGVSGYRRGTFADFQVVVHADEGSGWAQASSWRASDLDVLQLGREAAWKADLGRDRRAMDPGEYAVILDPYATQDLVTMLNLHGMGGVAFQDGRSWMVDRIGAAIMSPAISIWDDPLRVDFPPLPFDEEGVPKSRLDIIQNGVPLTPVYDRRTGTRAGRESTGHAQPFEAPSWARAYGPFPRHLVMGAGETSTQELIRSTEHGLYVTRFWYTRLVHPRDCVITGMTRDGVFLIRDGELAHAVKDLRFTQSYVEALANVDAVGRETRTLLAMDSLLATRVPALKLSAFRFTGATV